MMVQLKQPWKTWPIGHVIPEMQANVARGLIARGIVEEVKSTGKPFAAPVDRSVRSNQMILKKAR
jgi:hypothetical protein